MVLRRRQKKCSLCRRPGHDRRTCGRVTTPPKPFDEFRDLEWEEHFEVQRIVAEHPDGMSLEEVGDVLGITRERVRQIEAGALRKIREDESLADTVSLGAFTYAVIPCDRCGLLFARRARQRFCELCVPDPVVYAKPRRLRAVPEPPQAPVKRPRIRKRRRRKKATPGAFDFGFLLHG